MSVSRPGRLWSALMASAAIAGSVVLSGCGIVPSFLSDENSAGSSDARAATEDRQDPAAQQRFFDNAVLMIPMVTSFDPTSTWASLELAAWDDADPSTRDTIVTMGLDACERADNATDAAELSDPAMTWLAARFLCEEHRDAAESFLSNNASISPTHTMADLFELAIVQEDATADDLLDANTVCIGALALAWEVHAGFTPDATCWLIRVQSVEETGGNAEYLSLFEGGGDAEQAAVDARFGELAEASGATPNALSDLLDGME